MRRAVVFVLLALLVIACKKSRAFDAKRIPAGTGWQCWLGRCDRVCRGMPGAALADGTHPEPVCSRPKTAYCLTYTLRSEEQWECHETKVSCESSQKPYADRADDYERVSPCVEVP